MQLMEMNKEHCSDFCSLRFRLFEELGELDNGTNLPALEAATKDYYTLHIGKDLLCWGIEEEGKMVAIASLCLFSRLPYAENLSGQEGYVLNVYTLPSFRRRGLSKKLMDTILAYGRENGIGRLWLNSSEQGKSIYLQCGFTLIDNGMELPL